MQKRISTIEVNPRLIFRIVDKKLSNEPILYNAAQFRIMRTLKNLKYFNGWNIKHLCSLNAWLNIWIVDQNLILSNYSFDDDTDDTVFISKKNRSCTIQLNFEFYLHIFG